MSRHPSTEHLLKYFAFEHLPEGQPREISSVICNHANWLAEQLPDGPELSAGLRKLLEAKDCFVRAAIDARADS